MTSIYLYFMTSCTCDFMCDHAPKNSWWWAKTLSQSMWAVENLSFSKNVCIIPSSWRILLKNFNLLFFFSFSHQINHSPSLQILAGKNLAVSLRVSTLRIIHGLDRNPLGLFNNICPWVSADLTWCNPKVSSLHFSP